MFPNRRKKHLVTIFSQGHVLWPYKPMIYLDFFSQLSVNGCNQFCPTDFKNSNTKYKTKGIFPNSINEIICALHVWARLKHQFATSVECISDGQSYLCYIFFMELHIMTL